MNTRLLCRVRESKVAIMAFLLAVCCGLTYYFHVRLHTARAFTHFFYAPIVLACIWWRRRGLVVAVFLAAFLFAADHIWVPAGPIANDYARAAMFVVIGCVVVVLSERIAQRERALLETGQRIGHLNAALRGIRNVNQLIVRETDCGRLIQGICDTFVEARGCYNAWIVVIDESGRPVATAESGLGESFRAMLERLESGNIPACAERALHRRDVVEVEDPATACVDCPLAGEYAGRGAAAVRLEHAGTVHGLLALSIPKEFFGDAEELSLLREVASDIAYALHGIELAEQRDRQEEKRRQLEAKIEQAQKLESLGILAGGIAHDFNNLLMVMLGNADLALRDLSEVAPARPSVDEIKTAAVRASELTKQMLAYAGKGRFVVEALDLNELIEEMGHLLGVSISKKVVLRYEFADNLPAVEADATQMRQVVMNLITNASEAIGDRSGAISIATGVMEAGREYLGGTYLDEDLPEGYYVFMEVADTGCGMDEKTRSKVFDPFFSTKFTGRGLGLAAVLGIVRGHGGAIKVYSELGKGTTFKVLLPCSERPPQAAPAEGAEPAETRRDSGLLLVADDEEGVRTIAKRMLEGAGFTVLTAGDGRECVDVFRERADEIAAVLLDMTMPHMDGEETFRELRQIRPDVRVILTSGYNEQEATSRFTGKGLAGFIQKPYRYDDLLAKLREILRPE